MRKGAAGLRLVQTKGNVTGTILNRHEKAVCRLLVSLKFRRCTVLRGHLGVIFGDSPGSYRLSLGHGGQVARAYVVPSELQAGEDVRIVLAYNMGTQIATIWVNPTGRVDEPGRLPTTPGNPGIITSISMRMVNTGQEDLGTFRISRPVAATTFAEAMP